MAIINNIQSRDNWGANFTQLDMLLYYHISCERQVDRNSGNPDTEIHNLAEI